MNWGGCIGWTGLLWLMILTTTIHLNFGIPLMKQRFHGYLPEDWPLWRRGRFIHNHEHGSYTVGRHLSAHESMIYPPLACILWFGFSPWNDAMRKRKLQIGGLFLKLVSMGNGDAPYYYVGKIRRMV